MSSLFYQLIRVAIGTQERLSHLPSECEWGELYKMAQKQSLVGVCFAGVQRLCSNVGPASIGMPEELYLNWMAAAVQIQQRNEVINQKCVDLQERLVGNGFSNYIMKGQGNATLYGEMSLLRQPGDIDVYLDGGLNKVFECAHSLGETSGVNELEMHVKVFDDTDVEFHYRPFIMRNPFKNKKLQAFFKSQEQACFSNKVALPTGGEICVPTAEFNLVHQMVHIYHHLFTEGVGLRQLMDYYFVIKSCDNKEVLCRARDVIDTLGLKRFASALMWVLDDVFDVDEANLPWTPNKKDGEFLLKEIMLSGNFGKQDRRQKGLYDSKWNSFWIVNGKALRLARFDHWMWFWGPIWRIYHFVWRKVKGF